MTSDETSSRRLARQALTMLAVEGTFAIGLADNPEAERVAVAFEQLGCKVERFDNKAMIKVTPPGL